MPDYIALIPCAGSGSRFNNAQLPKQYHTVAGKSVLTWTIEAFLQVGQIKQIVLAANVQDSLIDGYQYLTPKIKILKCGGESRAHTIYNAIQLLDLATHDWLLVHDAARCCILSKDIQHLIASVGDSNSGGILATRAVDTVKELDVATGVVTKTLPRENIYLAQTPQMFRAGLLATALTNARHTAYTGITDEASAIELLAAEVKIIECGAHNFKITYPQDLQLAEMLLRHRG